MKKFNIIFIGLLGIAYSFSIIEENDWDMFMERNAKNYTDQAEHDFRMKIYLQNRDIVIHHNKLYAEGQFTFQMGFNEYSDMAHDEFVSKMMGFVPDTAVDSNKNQSDESKAHPSEEYHISKEIDWREKGAVSPIKNQKQCGSSWAFSAIGAIEGQYFRKTGVLNSLSEQHLIDCADIGGCDGGNINRAFEYLGSNPEIDSEKMYPYRARKDECKSQGQNVSASGVGFINIQFGNETKLQEMIEKIGPLSAVIDASHPSFQQYREGIYYEPECDPLKLNHAILIVGFGTDVKGNDYYIIKNSFGVSWGENGFAKIARNKNNHCGIASAASYPLV